MATYFVNALSSTQDGLTPATGYHTINALVGVISLNPGDVIEVTDDATVMETVPTNIPAGVTIRPWSGNSIMPTITIGGIGIHGPVLKPVGNNVTIKGIHGLSAPSGVEAFVDFVVPGLSGLLVEDCLLDGSGVTLYACSACIVRNNVFINISQAMHESLYMDSVDNVKIINNTFYNNGPDQADIMSLGTASNCTNVKISNNIFMNATHVVGPVWSGIAIEGDKMDSPSIDYNDVYGYPTPYHNCTPVPGPHTISPGQDPLFINAAMNDFSIPIGSPCYNTGIGPSADADTPTDSFNGIVRSGATSNMGAYEGSGTTTTPAPTTTTTTTTTPAPTTTTTTTTPAPYVALNVFTQSTVSVDSTAVSNINSAKLVAVIQAATGGDPYFDTTSELGRVDVYYTHQDGRQRKILHHLGGLTGTISWSDDARDGTWEKTQVKAFDKDGATVLLTRTDIGTSEDLTKSGSTINLNM